MIVDALKYLGVNNEKDLVAIPIEELRQKLRLNFPQHVRTHVYRLHGWCVRGTTMTVEHIDASNKAAMNLADSTMIIGIRADRLEDMISQAVLTAIRVYRAAEERSRPPATDPAPEELLTRDQAAQLLGITLPTLRDYTRRGYVTGYLIGTRVRYKRNEVLDSLQRIRAAKNDRT